jgi:cell division protein FtsL
VEFEGRTYLKNGANQVATASMEKLFEYLDESEMKEDQAAVEWVRRQMEQLRPFVVSPEIMERIDQSCDRPGSLNLRLVEKYQKAIAERISEPGFIEALLDQAIEQNDANACSAVFQMAREELQLIRPEAQLKLMAVIDKFPSQAFSDALRVDRDANRDAEARTEQFQAMSLAYIEQSARLEDAKQPSESDLKRRMEIKAREALPADEPIGLVI